MLRLGEPLSTHTPACCGFTPPPFSPFLQPECQFFTLYGECSNPECLFRHVTREDEHVECPWYTRGFCKRGPECIYKHVKKARRV